MKHHNLVADAFGSTAAAYVTSTVHSTGADLADLAREVGAMANAVVLDLGCGAGHVSFSVAPVASRVVAYDIAEPMLATVAGAAKERGLANIETKQGPAEELPFSDATFDFVLSRMSAHHWHDVPAALAEVRRVLKPGGRVIFVDIAGADHPLNDTHIQAVEVPRDGSHIRDYRGDEWLALFAGAGFDADITRRWRLPIQFDTWIARMKTPPERVVAIRSLWANAPDEVKEYFAVQDDGSFELDVVMMKGSNDCDKSSQLHFQTGLI